MLKTTRRQFGRQLGIIAASAVAPSCLCSSKQRRLSFDFFKRATDGSFERLAAGKSELPKAGEVSRRTRVYPLTKEEAFQLQNYLYGPGLAELCEKANLSVDQIANVRIDTTVVDSLGVVAETEEYARQFLEYCKFATEFMFNREEFSGLSKPRIGWMLPGEKKPIGSIPAFASHHLDFGLEFGVTLITKDGQENERGIHTPRPVGGGVCFVKPAFEVGSTEINDPVDDKTVIVVSTLALETTSLMSPFSEVLPLLFFPAISSYFDKTLKRVGAPKDIFQVNELNGHMSLVTETITESISAFLVQELLKKPEMEKARVYVSASNIEERVKNMPQDKDAFGNYSLVYKAYQHLKQVGLQEVVDMITTDLQQYLTILKS